MGNNTVCDLRIGLPIIGNRDWLGGVHYIKSIVEAVSRVSLHERPRLFLVVFDRTLDLSDLHRDILGLLDGIVFFGQDILRAKAMLPSPVLHCRTREELDLALDFFYPVVADVVPDLCSASWIYDFQHVYLPEFFPQGEIQSRNIKFKNVAKSAKLVVLSSKSAEQDFRRIFPGSKAVTRVLSFRSLPADEWLALDPSETQKKYALPDRFLLCCNQFWIHKNHRLLFEAMADAVQSAPDTQLVCTGATSDWRFQNYFSDLAAFLETHGLKDRIRILGQIPRTDQIQLMRRSLAVIQPSLFEGWSSVVEESRMLGKTIILSDLAVHHEQAPDHAVYFDRNNAKALAGTILSLLPGLHPGPDRTGETEAYRRSVALVEQFGRDFCRIALEALELFHKKLPVPAAGGDAASESTPTPEVPPPDAAGDAAAHAVPRERRRGLTIIAPENYTNKSWAEEAKRIFGDDADIAVLPPPSGDGFDNIRFREHILFLGASHHLPGLFDSADKISFWNSVPSKKYFYQYEKVLGSFLPGSEERERNVHKVQAESYAVQDEYDAVEYEKAFGEKALWLPDMISAERLRRGRRYPPLSQRPTDLLFVGKIQGAWYWQRQEILQRVQAFGDAHHLKTEIVDTSYMRFNDVDIIERDYYSQAKVVVNPIGTGSFFNIRFFETLAAGCVCLQQADNNSLFLHKFRERYKDYNAVYFTAADLEQNLSALFSDLPRFEKNVPHARELLMQNDTGEARFRALGISCGRPDCAHAKEEPGRRLSAKKKYPKISIVTPSFNQGQYLDECIDSVLGQNYPNLEYVVMDGGSTDNSVAIIKKYEKHLAYWHSRPDKGQYFAIDEGFKKTTGEIMTWINSDDFLHPRALETVAAIFRNFPNVEWLMGRSNGVVQKTGEFWIMDFPVLWSRENYLRRQYKYPYIQQEGTFWKRSLWEKAGGKMDTTLALAGDMELWARFFRYAQLYSVDAPLGAFRTHSAQKTAGSHEAYHREAEKIIDREIAVYTESENKTLLPAPPPITAEQVSALRDETALQGSSTGAEEKPLFKVSAIVSTFNAERFIRGCLEDLVNQTLYQQGGLEIIIVDSCSEQNEKAVVEEFQKQYRSITYIRTTIRETVYAAWNRGIKAARGEYITNANTDDRRRKDALEVMAALLDQKPGIGLVYADVIITETENETFEKHTRTGQYQWPDFDRVVLSIGCFIGPQPMWRKSLHDRYGYFDERFSASGDWEFWLRIAVGTRFLHIPEFLGVYLRSPHSLEHQNAGKRIEEDRSVYKTYIPKYLPAYDEYFTGMTGTDPNPVHIYRYGQVLAGFGRYDEAISLYESYVERNPEYQGFTFLLNDLKNAKARQSAAQAPPPPLPEEVMTYVNQADAHIANNDLASAREAIQQALRHTSGHPQLAAMLSNMLDSLNE